MNIYHIWISECRIPLTVIAADYDEAEQIYDQWHAAQDLGINYRLKRVTERDQDWLSDHPQLAGLTTQGTAGVAYWPDNKTGWVLANPDDEPRGELQPSETPVTYYLFEFADGKSFMVFATSPEHALNMYLAWALHLNLPRSNRFTIRMPSRFRMTGELSELREEMEAGKMGVAGKSDEEGWHILPPGHEAWDVWCTCWADFAVGPVLETEVLDLDADSHPDGPDAPHLESRRAFHLMTSSSGPLLGEMAGRAVYREFVTDGCYAPKLAIRPLKHRAWKRTFTAVQAKPMTGKGWDEAAVPSTPVERQLLSEAEVQRSPGQPGRMTKTGP